MERNQQTYDMFVQLVTRLVIEELEKFQRSVPIGVSNRHIHLDRADMDALFGQDSELTFKKELGQPGQYAAEETVTLHGPKGELGRVRVLGPLRSESQVEVSVTDGFALGVRPPIRESGKLKGTPGVTIVGPKGSIEKDTGTIAALRHIHLDPETAQRIGVKDKQMVKVEIGGLRGGIFHNVLIRVSEQFAPEMHIDVDEANAFGVKNGDRAYIIVD